MVIKKIEVASMAKLSGAMYATMGLLAGVIFSFFSLISSSMFTRGQSGINPGGMFGVLGVASIIVLPIIYGIMGLVAGFIAALIYNLFAKLVGGIKIQTEEEVSQVVGSSASEK